MGRYASRSSDCWPKGMDTLLVLTCRAAASLAVGYRDDLVSVFLLPPTLDELEKRLRGRNDDTEEAIAGEACRRPRRNCLLPGIRPCTGEQPRSGT